MLDIGGHGLADIPRENGEHADKKEQDGRGRRRGDGTAEECPRPTHMGKQNAHTTNQTKSAKQRPRPPHKRLMASPPHLNISSAAFVMKPSMSEWRNTWTEDVASPDEGS